MFPSLLSTTPRASSLPLNEVPTSMMKSGSTAPVVASTAARPRRGSPLTDVKAPARKTFVSFTASERTTALAEPVKLVSSAPSTDNFATRMGNASSQLVNRPPA